MNEKKNIHNKMYKLCGTASVNDVPKGAQSVKLV